jgi:hypothetical protein
MWLCQPCHKQRHKEIAWHFNLNAER